MPGGGTSKFLEPEDYEAGLRQAHIAAVIVSPGKFKARLTWADLQHSQVLRCEEDPSRVAYMHLAPQLAFVTFPVSPGPLPVWRGMELQAGNVMFHSRGERLHQSVPGASVWSVIAIDPAQLGHYGKALSGKPFSPPREGQVVRPSPRDATRLRRVHAQACRLAETKPKILSHSEVARAIEQDLIQALVACLATSAVEAKGFATRRHADIMVKFEEVLGQHLNRAPSILQLCELLGVSNRTLRTCCTEFLGMSPTRYMLLRRLRAVRSALREADPDSVNVADIAHRFGFAELGRFTGTYRARFGETPSATLQRAPGARFAARRNFPISA